MANEGHADRPAQDKDNSGTDVQIQAKASASVGPRKRKFKTSLINDSKELSEFCFFNKQEIN
jgi:hypothetical protein